MATRVQSTTSADSSPSTLAYTSNVTSGNLGICITRTSGGDSPPGSITDTRGSTWAQAGADVMRGTATLRVWWTKFPSSGANTITLVSQAGSTRIIIEEVSGITNPTYDQYVQASGSSTTPNSGSITTTVATWLVCAVNLNNYPSVIPTAGSGFTILNTTTTRFAAEDQDAASSGSYSGTMTLPASDSWTAGIWSFKAGSSAATSLVVPRRMARMSSHFR